MVNSQYPSRPGTESEECGASFEAGCETSRKTRVSPPRSSEDCAPGSHREPATLGKRRAVSNSTAGSFSAAA